MATAKSVIPIVNHFLSEGHASSKYLPKIAPKNIVAAIWAPIPDKRMYLDDPLDFFLSVI